MMNQMQARGLVQCRNPRLVTGRLYEFTAKGRAVSEAAFGHSLDPVTESVDWRKVLACGAREDPPFDLNGVERA